MAFVHPGDGALDYFPCHYGSSRLTFRGPRRDLTGEYLAMLGGTETYGRFVVAPFPALVEEVLGIPVANLACQNAGPDVYLADRPALEVASAAHLAVVQMTGVPNMTNRYYTVHPRRNDRFVAATPLLRSLYRDVDFTEIHFTRHLIHVLAARGPDRFAQVAAELKSLWVERMKVVLQRLPRRTVLLWMADRPPADPAPVEDLTGAPWMIDRQMIATLEPLAAGYVEHVISPAARAEGVQSMRFSPAEEAAAQGLPGAAVHHEVAQALIPVIEAML
ncbi:MAG: DUF6473 family protein [Paracoccaceae bacterium]